MEKLLNADVIKAAAASPLGIIALVVLMLGVIVVILFRNSPVNVRVGVFAALLLPACVFVVAEMRVANAQAAPTNTKNQVPLGASSVPEKTQAAPPATTASEAEPADAVRISPEASHAPARANPRTPSVPVPRITIEITGCAFGAPQNLGLCDSKASQICDGREFCNLLARPEQLGFGPVTATAAPDNQALSVSWRCRKDGVVLPPGEIAVKAPGGGLVHVECPPPNSR